MIKNRNIESPLYEYIDAEDKAATKSFTLVKGDNSPKVVDKILFAINDKDLRDRFEIVDHQEVGVAPL